MKSIIDIKEERKYFTDRRKVMSEKFSKTGISTAAISYLNFLDNKIRTLKVEEAERKLRVNQLSDLG